MSFLWLVATAFKAMIYFRYPRAYVVSSVAKTWGFLRYLILEESETHDTWNSMSMPFSILYCYAFRLILLSRFFAFMLTLQSSSDLSKTLPSLINTSNSSTLLADRQIAWECEDFWPTSSPGIARSCADALHRMNFVPGSATQQLIWGPRRIGSRYDVYLPQRVYSCMSSQPFTSSFD